MKRSFIGYSEKNWIFSIEYNDRTKPTTPLHTSFIQNQVFIARKSHFVLFSRFIYR